MIELDERTYVSNAEDVRAIRGTTTPNESLVFIGDSWFTVKRDPGYLAEFLKVESNQEFNLTDAPEPVAFDE